MGIPSPREMAKIRRIKATYLGLILSILLGQTFLLQDVIDAYNKIEEAERHIVRYDKTLSEFLTLMDLYEMGAYQPHLFEKLCQEGYAPGCLARGITALNPKGTADYDPELNRKQAEEFFQKGCAIEDFPVCRLITETRKDDGFRDPQDEERVVTGILMLICDLGADEVCGDAAMRLFEAGDFQMARGYATKGCAMKNPLGVPYRDPRSCDYRKRALAKLAEAQEVPAELEEPVPAALEATTDKQ